MTVWPCCVTTICQRASRQPPFLASFSYNFPHQSTRSLCLTKILKGGLRPQSFLGLGALSHPLNIFYRRPIKFSGVFSFSLGGVFFIFLPPPIQTSQRRLRCKILSFSTKEVSKKTELLLFQEAKGKRLRRYPDFRLK